MISRDEYFNSSLYKNLLKTMNVNNTITYPYDRVDIGNPTAVKTFLDKHIGVWGISYNASEMDFMNFPGSIFFDGDFSINKDFKLLISTRPDMIVPNLTFTAKEVVGVDGTYIDSSNKHGTSNITLAFSAEFKDEETISTYGSQMLYDFFVRENFAPMKFWFSNKIYMVRCNSDIRILHNRTMGNFIIGTIDLLVQPNKFLLINPTYKQYNFNFYNIKDMIYRGIDINYPIDSYTKGVSKPMIYFKIDPNMLYKGHKVSDPTHSYIISVKFTINDKEFVLNQIELDKWYIVDSINYHIYMISDGDLYSRNSKLVGFDFPELSQVDNNLFKMDINLRKEQRSDDSVQQVNVWLSSVNQNEIDIKTSSVFINSYWRVK